MAECPKCHKHLRLIDWKQTCKNCGANIFVYDLQERLMQDADIAEVQNYHFQKKVDRLKASFIGSKLAITRIVTSIIPIAALFLPLINAKTVDALSFISGNVSLLTIYNNVDGITDEVKNLLLHSEGSYLLIGAVACLLISVIALLLHLILLILACSPKGKQRNYTLDIILCLTSIAAPILFMLLPETAPLTGSLGIGAYLYVALLIVNFVIDILVFRQGIEVKHKQCFVGGIPIEEYFEMQERGVPQAEIRQEQYRRLQAIQDEKIKELAEREEKEKDKKAEVNANG